MLRLLLTITMSSVLLGCSAGPGLHGGVLHGERPTAKTWPKTMTARCKKLEPLIERSARTRKVDRGLVAGIIRVAMSGWAQQPRDLIKE